MTPEQIAELMALGAELKKAAADFKAEQGKLKEAHDQVMNALQKGVELPLETRQNIDAQIAKMVESGKQVTELAQSIDSLKKSIKEGPARPMTTRAHLMKSLEGDAKEAYGRLINREGKSLKLVVKDTIDMAAVAGITPDPYVDTLVGMQRRPLLVRDLLTIIPVNTDSVRYGQQTVRTNAAAIVAEGTSKPYSTYKWENRTASVEVIAHLAKMTLQAIADAPRLVAEIESEMRYGLGLVEDDELLNGDGSSGHLSGLMHNATAYALPSGANAALIVNPADKLRAAILQLALQYVQPDGMVLNPVDVFNIRMLRDGQNNYLFGNPNTDSPVTRLWGVSIAETTAQAQNSFLVGAMKFAANLYQREGVTVLISTENDDDFEKNLATMRVEEREGLGVRRPWALVKGTLSSGS